MAAIPDTLFFQPAFPFSDYCLKHRKAQSATDRPKKQEYGVLQAVGMTNKQLNLCLQLQGLMFTVGTICVALIIGLPLGYALFSYAKHNGIFGMNIYHVPIVPILIMIFLVGLLQIVLSCVLSSNLKRETLVERIRYQG